MDQVIDTLKRCLGVIGDNAIFALIPSKQALIFDPDLKQTACFKRVVFEMTWYRVNHVEPGAFPLKGHKFALDPIERKMNHAVAAYRCTQCRTLFIVPRVEDLAHKCTEPFDQEEYKACSSSN